MSYLLWHYTRAITSGLSLFWTGLKFLVEFFSIKQFVVTFFAPWKRMHDDTPSVLDTKKFFEAVVINTLMRVVGMVMKTMVLVIGCVVVVLFCATGVIGGVLWILAPLLIALVLYFGLVPLIDHLSTV